VLTFLKEHFDEYFLAIYTTVVWLLVTLFLVRPMTHFGDEIEIDERQYIKLSQLPTIISAHTLKPTVIIIYVCFL
jgi:hypothetical protein